MNLPFVDGHTSPFKDLDNNDRSYAVKITERLGIQTLTNNVTVKYSNEIFFSNQLILDLLSSGAISKEDKKFIKKNQDKVMYIPSTLYLKRVSYKGGSANEIDKNEVFFNLKNEDLMKVIFGKYISRVKRILIDGGIIETDDNYIINQKSKGYRLSKLKRYNDWHRKRTTKLNIPYNVSDAEWIYLKILESSKRVKINRDKAIFLFEMEMDDKTDHSIECNKFLIQLIDDGFLNLKIDYKTGRMFTAITNLSKELRGCLEIDGEQLIELDIASSQPLLLAKLYREECDEYYKYKDLVESGSFYEFMIEKTGGMKTREQIKNETYRYMFGLANNPNCAEYAFAFKKEFPIMDSILKSEKDDELWKHKIVALKMQTIEAGIILGEAAVRCIFEGIDIITIHDSFMVKPAHKDRVLTIMKESFAKIGLIPTIKQKMFKSIDFKLRVDEFKVSYAVDPLKPKYSKH